MSSDIPMIDVSGLTSGGSDAIRPVVLEIGAACERHGFFYIRGHGLSGAFIESMFVESARFFAQPLESKLKTRINRANRGYVPPGTSAQKISSVDSPKRGNEYESLMIRDELKQGEPQEMPGNPMHGPNQWPQNLPGFKEACLEYYDALHGLARRFPRSAASGISTPWRRPWLATTSSS